MNTVMGAGGAQQNQLCRLDGVRLLLVEDEYYIADDMVRALKNAGADVVGPISTLAAAIDAVDTGRFDCAVVDLNLHGESAVPVVDRLIDGGHPFVIATGYGSLAIPDRLTGVPRLEKPFDPNALLRALAQQGCVKIPLAGS